MLAVELKNLSYTYSAKTPYEKRALDGVSLAVEEGEFVGLIGATGSGKSTLIQHLNGLVKTQEGEVVVAGMNARDKKTLKKLRFKVGMVFQYPEYQLFEDTVAKDVAFGPKNMKLEKEEVDRRVRRAMEVVGLPYDEFAERSPFELSGGEKRRAAIAGVIAMEPEILVLDEPVAGLDPAGRKEILGLVKKLHEEVSPTVIMVSHYMDDIAEMADRIVALRDGKVVADGSPADVFGDREALAAAGLALPTAARVVDRLAERGIELSRRIVTPAELVDALVKYRSEKPHARRKRARKRARKTRRTGAFPLRRQTTGREEMFKDIAFGQYYPTDSVVHRMDPRMKLFLTVLFVVAIFFVNTYFGFMLTAAVLLFIILLAKLPMLSVLKSVRAIIFIVIFAAVINLFMISDGEVLWSWRALQITDQGIHTTIKMTLRLVLLISGASLLTLTTTPVEVADGTESLMKPLRLIKVPVHDIAMIMSIALRFIPTLFEETNKIIAAQKARGASFDTGGLIARAKALLPVLIPLFVNSFRRADELAFAMDARCYNATENRTKMKVMKLGVADFVAFFLIAAYFVAVLLDRYYFGGAMDTLIFGGLV